VSFDPGNEIVYTEEINLQKQKMTKHLFEVLAYDRTRHIIETLEFPELEPPDKFEIVMTGHLEDVKYTIKGKPQIIMASSTSYGKANVALLSTTEDVRNHMLDVLDRSFVTQITTLQSSSFMNACISSSDIIRLLGYEKNNKYTKLSITATYEEAFTKATVIPVEDNRSEVLLQTFVLTDDVIFPVVEMFKNVKNHKCAMTHLKRAFKISMPFHESFVTVTREHSAQLFDFLTDTPTCYDRPFLDDLVEAAWHPDRLKNVLNENDEVFGRWR
jgi:hypothetical protein